MQQSATIQRQYDEVIATNYDLDPQSITGDSLERALAHLTATGIFDSVNDRELRVLDLGMGTGLFLAKLMNSSPGAVAPCGIDLSASMIDIARQKLPNLEAYVDDAANFDGYFGDEQFDLICTHFITGFVPIETLAPLVMKRLRPGGYWSFVGASCEGYPALRQQAGSPVVKAIFGAGSGFDDMICPKDQEYLTQFLEAEGFELPIVETYEPELWFPNYDAFMEYAYTGGWLTPFIEEMGLHKAGKLTQKLLNAVVFPVRDHHSILQALACKPQAGED